MRAHLWMTQRTPALWTTRGTCSPACQTRAVPRFLLLSDVAETLNVSLVQARALVTSGELPAIQVGGRGQWRVEATELEAYIQRKYAEAREKTRGQTSGKLGGGVDGAGERDGSSRGSGQHGAGEDLTRS